MLLAICQNVATRVLHLHSWAGRLICVSVITQPFRTPVALEGECHLPISRARENT